MLTPRRAFAHSPRLAIRLMTSPTLAQRSVGPARHACQPIYRSDVARVDEDIVPALHHDAVEESNGIPRASSETPRQRPKSGKPLSDHSRRNGSCGPTNIKDSDML